MKKKFFIGLFFLLIGVGGCGTMKEKTEIQALYPKSTESFVGDPMPFYDGKEFKMYYLEDLRDGKIGFHPFSLMTTTDFYHYQDIGEVIPYVNEEESPERALGTGSVIQDEEGLYHAFYTGHNGERTPKEVIMHATSKDGKKWKKIPEDTFEGDDSYEKNDFRDPYVFFEETSQSYWMLITTRQNGRGIIAKYTSTDLKTWQNEGTFFENDFGNDSNMECPSLLEFHGTWYLAFSDQWDQRVVHYRTADTINGPFTKPAGNDHVDGAGFYAGRLETDGERLYLVGWIPTKESHDDRFNYNWAGNLAVHQLVEENGQLVPQLPDAAYEQVEKVSFQSKEYTKGESIKVDESAIISEGTLEVTGDVQIALEIGTENVILLDFSTGVIQYYNTFLEDIPRRNPLTEMPLTTEEINLKIVHEGDIVVIYDGEHALSNRIYQSQNKVMEMTVLEGTVKVK